MAIYHCSMKIIGRSSGRSVVGASAYRAGEKLKNEYDGMTHDYTKKKGIEYSEIMIPENAPREFLNREKLWNAVEIVEKNKKAQLAREIEFALPKELDKKEQIKLTQEFVKDNFINNGMCADLSIHDKGDGNPHAHIMLTMRPLDVYGAWGEKQKKIYVLDENGNKIYDKKKHQYKCSTEKTTNWDSVEFLEGYRKDLADKINKQLEKKGVKERVDHRSYEEQGIEKIPTIHEGTTVREMEKRGIKTDIGELNRVVQQENKMVDLINRQMEVHERGLKNGAGIDGHGVKDRDNGIKRDNTESRSYNPRDNRIKQADAVIHQGAYERGHNEKNNSIGRTGKDKINQSGSTRQDDFDITKAREHVEGLQRQSTRDIREWQERNDGNQSKSNNENDRDKRGIEQEHERSTTDHGEEIERVREGNYDLSR